MSRSHPTSRSYCVLAIGFVAGLTMGGVAAAQTTIPGPTTAQVAPANPAVRPGGAPRGTAAETVNPTPMPPGSIAGNAPGMSPATPAPRAAPPVSTAPSTAPRNPPPGTLAGPPIVPGGTATVPPMR